MSESTRYWFDTEFMEDGTVVELLSIGVVCDDGREFYAESSDADWSHANEWVVENVLPHMTGPGEPRDRPWAYFGDYDWVVLCQLYGRMVDLPASWPKFALDVKQEAVRLGDRQLPSHEGTAHNALDDARWTHLAWGFLQSLKGWRG